MVALIISSAHYCGKKEADDVVPTNTDSTTVSVDASGKSKPSGKYAPPSKYGPSKNIRSIVMILLKPIHQLLIQIRYQQLEVKQQ